jgi:hypothetical protein
VYECFAHEKINNLKYFLLPFANNVALNTERKVAQSDGFASLTVENIFLVPGSS